MPLVEWSEKFSVGLRSVDTQHQKLLGICNKLHDAMKSGAGKDALEPTLRELVSYTRTHFASEEQLLAKSNYPTLAAHKLQHTNLLRQVDGYVDKFNGGNTLFAVQLAGFLKDWLLSHIADTDRQYSAHLKAAGIQ